MKMDSKTIEIESKEEDSSSSSEYYSIDNEREENEDQCMDSDPKIFVDIDDPRSFDASNENSGNKWRAKRISVPSILRLIFKASPSITQTRVYQVWPGNNVFFFGGRIICGPDPRGFFVTLVSIFLSNWIFCVYVANAFNPYCAIAVTSSMVLAVIVIINLTVVSTRDPGIVPRNEKPPSKEICNSFRTRSLRISVDGVDMKLKFCRICLIFRPPRTCHCAVCDNCVEKFDHHCPWIGQCIGLRNYRYYMMFIMSAFVFFTYIFTFSCLKIKKQVSNTERGVFQTLGSMPETLGLALFSFVSMWFLGGLVVFHVYLTSINQTARENFKHRYTRWMNPYDKGVFRNIKEALFLKLGPSKVNFRAIIKPEYGFVARMLMNTRKEEEGNNTRQ